MHCARCMNFSTLSLILSLSVIHYCVGTISMPMFLFVSIVRLKIADSFLFLSFFTSAAHPRLMTQIIGN